MTDQESLINAIEQVDTIESSEIRTALKEFIVETTYTPAEQVNDETLIFEQGIFDSMGFISLINFLEEKYGIHAEDADLLEENFESVNAITAFIRKKLN